MLKSSIQATTRQLFFIVKNTTLRRMRDAFISFDHARIRVLKALGKDGLIKLFSHCIANDFKFYKQYVGTGPNITYVDIGCGSGTAAYYIHQKTGVKTICLDITDQAFNPDLKQKLNPAFSFTKYQADTSLPFANQSIDVATMHYVLHHCDYTDGNRLSALKLLQEARRMIKNGGTLVLLEEPILHEKERIAKDKMDLYANQLFNAGAVDKSHFYFEWELKAQLVEAGFDASDIKEIKMKEWSWLIPRTLYILTVRH